MTVIDFHPEDLLEREQAGPLSAADQRRLAEHLAHCTSCRIERQLRADFERELGVQTAPDMLQTLVSGALRAAGAAEPSPEARVQAQPRPRVFRFRRPLAVVLAAGVALGTALAAAQPGVAARALDFARERVSVLLGRNLPSRNTAQNPAPRSDAAVGAAADDAADDAAVDGTAPPARLEAAEAAAPRPRVPGAVEPIQPAMIPSAPPASTLAAPLPAAPAPGPATEDRRVKRGDVTRASPTEQRRHPASASTTRPLSVEKETAATGAVATEPAATDAVATDAATTEPATTRAPAKPAAAPRLGPAALFDRANAARSGGSGAEGLYEELQARFPDSAEARLSLAILGRMKLDAGDARAAIVHFEAYLSTGDHALREQAMAGCALGWAQLGRLDRERQSWRALLAAYPDSSYAPVARRRLERGAL